jgi:hypothetical protein
MEGLAASGMAVLGSVDRFQGVRELGGEKYYNIVFTNL